MTTIDVYLIAISILHCIPSITYWFSFLPLWSAPSHLLNHLVKFVSMRIFLRFSPQIAKIPTLSKSVTIKWNHIKINSHYVVSELRFLSLFCFELICHFTFLAPLIPFLYIQAPLNSCLYIQEHLISSLYFLTFQFGIYLIIIFVFAFEW